MKLSTIYALMEESGEIRYIGKTDKPKTRLREHYYEIKYGQYRRANWLRSLKVPPILVIIAEVPTNNWQYWERHFIRYFRGLGFDLVNATPGGDGVGSGPESPLFGKTRIFSAETRFKMRMAKLGKKQTPEQIACRFTPAGKLKMRAAKLGKKQTPEHIARRFTPANRLKMGMANRGKKQTPEHIASRVKSRQLRKEKLQCE